MRYSIIVLCLALVVLVIYGFVRLAIWIIKTAIKQALREYEQEKQSGSQEH